VEWVAIRVLQNAATALVDAKGYNIIQQRSRCCAAQEYARRHHVRTRAPQDGCRNPVCESAKNPVVSRARSFLHFRKQSCSPLRGCAESAVAAAGAHGWHPHGALVELVRHKRNKFVPSRNSLFSNQSHRQRTCTSFAMSDNNVLERYTSREIHLQLRHDQQTLTAGLFCVSSARKCFTLKLTNHNAYETHSVIPPRHSLAETNKTTAGYRTREICSDEFKASLVALLNVHPAGLSTIPTATMVGHRFNAMWVVTKFAKHLGLHVFFSFFLSGSFFLLRFFFVFEIEHFQANSFFSTLIARALTNICIFLNNNNAMSSYQQVLDDVTSFPKPETAQQQMVFKIVELTRNAVVLAQNELSAVPSKQSVKWRTEILEAAQHALCEASLLYSAQRGNFLHTPASGSCNVGHMGKTVTATQKLCDIFSGPFVDRTYHYPWLMSCKYVATYGGTVP
jgi:hypothetical protein